MTKEAVAKEKNTLPFISECDILDSLSSQQKERLAGMSSFCRFKSGSVVFNQGALPDGGYIISTGHVLMRKLSEGERSVVVEMLGPKDPFGLVSAAQEIPYPLTAEVLRECVALKFEQRILRELLAENSNFRDDLFRICVARMQSTHATMAQLIAGSAEARVARSLCVFSEKFGVQADGVRRVELTRKELAEVAATSIETCIRITKAFEGQGLLSFPSPRRIDILDVSKLGALVVS